MRIRNVLIVCFIILSIIHPIWAPTCPAAYSDRYHGIFNKGDFPDVQNLSASIYFSNGTPAVENQRFICTDYSNDSMECYLSGVPGSLGVYGRSLIGTDSESVGWHRSFELHVTNLNCKQECSKIFQVDIRFNKSLTGCSGDADYVISVLPSQDLIFMIIGGVLLIILLGIIVILKIKGNNRKSKKD